MKYDYLIDEWVVLYAKSNISAAKIAIQYSVHETTVLKYLNLAGINTSKFLVTPSDISLWVDLYTQGNSTYRIAERCGVHHSTVWKYLRNANVDMRKYVPATVDVEAWCDLYTRHGKNASEIAAMYETNHKTVIRHIRKSGVDTSKSRATRKMINEWVELYTTRNISTHKLAEMYPMSQATILRHLSLEGVDTSAYTYDVGRIYLISYHSSPIYVGQTQLSINRRLYGHLWKAHRRIGTLARFIDDNNLTEVDLDIVCIEDDIPVAVLTEREIYYINKYSIDANINLLNDNYNSSNKKEIEPI